MSYVVFYRDITLRRERVVCRQHIAVDRIADHLLELNVQLRGIAIREPANAR
jgi:hypothetical protein